jgi:hypothetical protein
VSEALGGEEGLRALAAEGLGLILDVVPNHMAASDENPFWRDPDRREQFFDLDPATGRHRRFFDVDELAGVRQEDEEVFETTHGLVLRLVAEGVATACGSTTSTGSPTRPAICAACRRGAPTASGSRRSSSRASRCATGRSRGRRATSSRTIPPRSSSIRPPRSG